jgi:hypothetical protein
LAQCRVSGTDEAGKVADVKFEGGETDNEVGDALVSRVFGVEGELFGVEDE